MNIDRILEAWTSKSAEEQNQIRRNAERWQSTGTPEQKATAARLLDGIVALEENNQQALLARLGNLEIAARLAEAFRAVPLTETERSVIQALLDNPGSTSRQLSAAVGWKDRSWQLHFGSVWRDRGIYLWPAPKFEDNTRDFYSGIVATFDGKHFTMKPEVVDALAALGIRARAG